MYAQDEITYFRISETWRKHATSCFRYFCVLRKRKIHVYVIPSRFRNGNAKSRFRQLADAQKVVRFRCIRSNGNVSRRHETAYGNTGYPSCFRIGFTCFCDVFVTFLGISPWDVYYRSTPVGKRSCRTESFIASWRVQKVIYRQT